MRGQIGQPDRPSLAENETEDAVAIRWGPDAAAELRVDPVGREALEGFPVRSAHADRRVARSDHLRGHLHHALEDPFERDLGD
jgi:hypothetical protein